MAENFYEALDSSLSPHNLSCAAAGQYPLIEQERRSTIRKSRLGILCASLGILLFIIFLGVNIKTGPKFAASLHQDQHGHCGQSPSEAKSRGCEFDIMSFSWLKPECYDHELVEEFSRLRDWQWFLDEKSEAEVPKETVRQGELDNLFVSMEYHFFHCTYMWRKLHRSLEGKARVDSYIGNYNHTVHCEHMLLMRHVLMKERNTVIRVKYPQCDGVL